MQTAIKELLDADRASLFLLDKQTQELHACIFSVTNEESADVNTVHLDQDPTTPSHIEDHISNLGKKPLDIVSYRGKRVRYVNFNACKYSTTECDDHTASL